MILFISYHVYNLQKTRNKILDEEKIVPRYERHTFYFCNSKNLKRKEFKIS